MSYEDHAPRWWPRTRIAIDSMGWGALASALFLPWYPGRTTMEVLSPPVVMTVRIGAGILGGASALVALAGIVLLALNPDHYFVERMHDSMAKAHDPEAIKARGHFAAVTTGLWSYVIVFDGGLSARLYAIGFTLLTIHRSSCPLTFVSRLDIHCQECLRYVR